MSPLSAALFFFAFFFLPSFFAIKCLNCRTTDDEALMCDSFCEGDICALWKYREMSTNLLIQGCLIGADLRSPSSRLKMGCRCNGAGARLCLCRDVPLCNIDIGPAEQHSSTDSSDPFTQLVMPMDIRCHSHTSASFIARQLVRPPLHGCHSNLCFLSETNISRPSSDVPLANRPHFDLFVSHSCGPQREFNFDILLGSLWPGNGLHSDACYQLEDTKGTILGCSCSNNDCNRNVPYPINSAQKHVKCHLERLLFPFPSSSNASRVKFCYGHFCFIQRMPFPTVGYGAGQWEVNSGCLSTNESAARTSLQVGYRNILGIEQWLCDEDFCNLITGKNAEEAGDKVGRKHLRFMGFEHQPTLFLPQQNAKIKMPLSEQGEAADEHHQQQQQKNHPKGGGTGNNCGGWTNIWWTISALIIMFLCTFYCNFKNKIT